MAASVWTLVFCVVPTRVIAHNDRRAVGPVFGVGLASIGILPTSATVNGAPIMLALTRHGRVGVDPWSLRCVVFIVDSTVRNHPYC